MWKCVSAYIILIGNRCSFSRSIKIWNILWKFLVDISYLIGAVASDDDGVEAWNDQWPYLDLRAFNTLLFYNEYISLLHENMSYL